MCVCLRQGLGWNQRQSSLACLPFPTSPLPQRWGSEPGDSPASLGLFFLPLKPALPLLLIELFPTHLPCACIWREEPTSSSCKDLKPLGEREIDRSHVDLWDIAAHSLMRKHPVVGLNDLSPSQQHKYLLVFRHGSSEKHPPWPGEGGRGGAGQRLRSWISWT